MVLASADQWKHWKKNIVLFLGSQTISLFGSALVNYAIIWYITLNTQSGMMMTISILCSFLPTFFLSPFAGVWADRYNRKMLIVASDALIAVSTLVMAVLFLLGYDALWMLFVISVIRSVGSGIQSPAVNAMVPQIVPGNRLTRVNGVNGSIQSLVWLVAPMVSAALLTMSSLEVIFFIDVITAAIAIFILLVFLRIPAHRKAQQKQNAGYFSDLKLGYDYIRHHAFLKKLFLFFAAFFFLSAPYMFLTPLQVTRSFGDDVWRLTAVEIVYSIGMITGGAIMASWGGFRNKMHTMTLACVTTGACIIALGVVPVFWIYLFFMGLAGVVMPAFNTPATVLLQEKVDSDYLGRVFGVQTMISTSMTPLGMLVFGPIADVVAIEWLLIGTGILVFFMGFYLSGSKELIEAGKPVPKETSS